MKDSAVGFSAAKDMVFLVRQNRTLLTSSGMRYDFQVAMVVQEVVFSLYHRTIHSQQLLVTTVPSRPVVPVTARPSGLPQ